MDKEVSIISGTVLKRRRRLSGVQTWSARLLTVTNETITYYHATQVDGKCDDEDQSENEDSSTNLRSGARKSLPTRDAKLSLNERSRDRPFSFDLVFTTGYRMSLATEIGADWAKWVSILHNQLGSVPSLHMDQKSSRNSAEYTIEGSGPPGLQIQVSFRGGCRAVVAKVEKASQGEAVGIKRGMVVLSIRGICLGNVQRLDELSGLFKDSARPLTLNMARPTLDISSELEAQPPTGQSVIDLFAKRDQGAAVPESTSASPENTAPEAVNLRSKEPSDTRDHAHAERLPTSPDVMNGPGAIVNEAKASPVGSGGSGATSSNVATNHQHSNQGTWERLYAAVARETGGLVTYSHAVDILGEIFGHDQVPEPDESISKHSSISVDDFVYAALALRTHAEGAGSETARNGLDSNVERRTFEAPVGATSKPDNPDHRSQQQNSKVKPTKQAVAAMATAPGTTTTGRKKKRKKEKKSKDELVTVRLGTVQKVTAGTAVIDLEKMRLDARSVSEPRIEGERASQARGSKLRSNVQSMRRQASHSRERQRRGPEPLRGMETKQLGSKPGARHALPLPDEAPDAHMGKLEAHTQSAGTHPHSSAITPRLPDSEAETSQTLSTSLETRSGKPARLQSDMVPRFRSLDASVHEPEDLGREVVLRELKSLKSELSELVGNAPLFERTVREITPVRRSSCSVEENIVAHLEAETRFLRHEVFRLVGLLHTHGIDPEADTVNMSLQGLGEMLKTRLISLQGGPADDPKGLHESCRIFVSALKKEERAVFLEYHRRRDKMTRLRHRGEDPQSEPTTSRVLASASRTQSRVRSKGEMRSNARVSQTVVLTPEALSKGSSQEHQGEWIQYFDSHTKRFYYFNAVSGDTKWKLPKGVKPRIVVPWMSPEELHNGASSPTTSPLGVRGRTRGGSTEAVGPSDSDKVRNTR